MFPGLLAYAGWGLLVLRLVVGIIFIVHGWPKMTNARALAQAFGQPSAGMIAFLTAQGIVETVGGVAMILGLWVQVVAIIFGVIMLGAIGLKTTMMKTGFTAQQATGWEFDLALLAASVVQLLAGAGTLSLM